MWKQGIIRKFLRANIKEELEYTKATGTPFWEIENLICDNCGMITMVFTSIEYEYCPHCGKKHKEGEKHESTKTE